MRFAALAAALLALSGCIQVLPCRCGTTTAPVSELAPRGAPLRIDRDTVTKPDGTVCHYDGCNTICCKGENCTSTLLYCGGSKLIIDPDEGARLIQLDGVVVPAGVPAK